jgi:peptidyl-prolyl cis-trans isomerase SurA
MKHTFCLLILSLTTTFCSIAQVSQDDILLTISDQSISVEEFMNIYKKNLNLVQDDTQKDLDYYLDLFVNYKLKVMEAKALGYDKSSDYIKELAKYQDQLSESYMTNSEVTEELIKEAYDRTANQVKAQHILVKLDKSNLDTLAALQQIQSYKNRFETEDFKTIKADLHNGSTVFVEDLGYFSAFRMVYEFESKAFNTPTGKVSAPFRTQFGYHIVKILDRRPSLGRAHVRHLMISKNQKDTTITPKDRIQELYQLLLQGEDFSALAQQFSEDKSSSTRGGELQPFESGQLNSEPFETAAFSLKYPGDISEPISTRFGWHILQLIEKTPQKSFDELRSQLKQKVARDPRSRLVQVKMIEALKKDYKVQDTNPHLSYFNSFITPEFYRKDWTVPLDFRADETFLTIQERTYSNEDFMTFLMKNKRAVNKNLQPEVQLQQQYISYLGKTLVAFRKSNLENENPEFAKVLNEYREGLLLFDLMEDKVWNLAKTDSLGLKTYFDKNQSQYNQPMRFEAIVARSSSSKIIKKVKQLLTDNVPLDKITSQFNSKDEQQVIFTERLMELNDQALPKDYVPVQGLSKVYKQRDASYLVEVKAIFPARPKTFDEAQGALISDFQIDLENQWLETLKSKYPVTINGPLLEQLKIQNTQ